MVTSRLFQELRSLVAMALALGPWHLLEVLGLERAMHLLGLLLPDRVPLLGSRRQLSLELLGQDPSMGTELHLTLLACSHSVSHNHPWVVLWRQHRRHWLAFRAHLSQFFQIQLTHCFCTQLLAFSRLWPMFLEVL